ncbi:MAG: O-methyltransferase [Aquaticitalea sp.]
MYQILSYIKFLLKSKNQHGVHSPFVFDLVTKCFYDKTDYPKYSNIKSYRDSLLNNSQNIEITDFGSGSRVFDSNKRVISDIAKNSGTSFKRAKLLFRLVSYFESKTILELGTSLGIATYSLALGKSDSTLLSIEGCPEISKFTKEQLQKFQVENVDLKTGSFSEIIPTLEKTNWDLVFFDGHHDKNATLDYFEQILPSIHNDSVFIFDDIHWSKGMTEAWESIKNHPQVTVTIDTFFWGFVFFRKEQVKEHFVIRL